jgi:PAS domain S-box-containing protein
MSILIYHIEDNLGDQVIVRRYLEAISRWSIKVVSFKRLTDAFTGLKVDNPDLILLDLSLPDANNLKGLETILALYPEACVVVLTGDLRKDLGYSAIEMGADDFLVKKNLRSEDLERTLGFSLARNKLKGENKLLKQDLFISNSRLDGFVSANFAYIIRTDIEGNYTYFNNLFKDTFTKTNEEIIGQSFLNHIYPEDHAAAMKTAALSKQHPGQVYSVTLRKHLLIPGLLATTIWDFIALTTPEGKLIEIQCNGYDLTEQNQNQLEIHRTRKVNELILRNSSSLSLLLDNNFKVEYEIGNHAAIFEGVDTLVGRDFEKLLLPSDRKLWSDFIETVNNTENDTEPLKIRILNNGNSLWVNISMNFIGTENQINNKRYSLVVKNINDEHLREISTIYNEKKYRALFENNPSIIITADFETGKIVEVNKAFENKLKIKAEDSLGKTIAELKIWKNEATHKDFLKQLGTKGDHRIAQTKFKCSDASSLTVNLNGIVINLNNQLLKILIAEDINKEILLSQELKNKEEIYRGLINNSSDLYLVLDKNSKIIFASPQLSVLDYNHKNVINSNFLKHVGAADQEYIESVNAELWTAKSSSSVNLKAFKIINRFGTSKWFSGRISYLAHFPLQTEGVIVCYLSDIHKEYQLEKEKNSFYEQSLEALSDLKQYKKVLDKHALVTLMDLQGQFLYANDYFCEVNGYGILELLGKSTCLINAPDQPEDLYEDLWKTLKAGKVWQGELKNRRKDGSLYWSKTTIAPRIDENTSEIINYISVSTDISNFKKKQAALNLKKTDPSNTLNSINQEVWSVNKEYQLTTFNKLFHRNFKALFNFDLKTKQNMLEIEVLTKEVRDRFQKRYDQAFNGEGACYLDEYIDPSSGLKKSSELRVRPTLNAKGKIIGATVYVQDVTQRKEQEEELRELIIRFELVTKASNIGIWDFDIEKNKMSWDDNMFALYEIDNKVEITFNKWTKSISPKILPKLLTNFNQALQKKPNFNATFKINVKEGIKSISALAKIIRDANGKAVRAVGLNWDISKTVQNEESLRKSLREKNAILSSIKDGFVVLDQNLQVLSINKSACSILDVDEKEIIGNSLWPQSQDKEISEFYPVFKSCLNTNTVGSVIGLSKTSKKWIDACIYPQDKGLVIFFNDISKERNESIKLEKVQNNQAALINTTLDLIWSLNPNLELIAFNDQFSQHQVQIGEKTPIEGSSIFNKNSSPYKNLWQLRYRSALAGNTIKETTCENNLSYELSLYPIINFNNEIEGVACYARDITKTEANLNTIKKQNNNLKEIAWMQSHIMRAPVARILGLIELINDEKLSTSKELSDYLANIDSSANELDQIVKKITKKTYSTDIKGI